ncbi:MAG TPA: FixH family protein [Ktedonobacterales bacterium]|nr:FixH family protein [Ktedonobacterales bacterium]
MSVTPQTTSETEPRPRRQASPRLLALAVVVAILAVLGVGALADTLAVAPLRPPTREGATQQAGLYTLTLTVSPEPLTASAETNFTLRITDVSGAPVGGARVICDYTMPAMPMPTMRMTATSGAAGTYICRETLTDAGAWALTITLTPPGGAPVYTTFPLQAR